MTKLETANSKAVTAQATEHYSTGRPKKPMWTRGIVIRALRDSLLKLNPRTLMKNPVIFVVEVGALITTVELLLQIGRAHV